MFKLENEGKDERNKTEEQMRRVTVRVRGEAYYSIIYFVYLPYCSRDTVLYMITPNGIQTHPMGFERTF